MPSKDLNGKRLPGNQQRSLARIRRGDTPPQQTAPTEPEPLTCSLEFFEVSPPPINDGVDAVAAWFARVLSLCVDVLSEGIDPKAVLLAKSIKASVKMQTRAIASEAALNLRSSRLGVPYDLTAPRRPPDDLATHAWAFCRLAAVVYDIAQCPELDKVHAAHFAFLVSALATFDGIKNEPAAQALKSEIEAEG